MKTPTGRKTDVRKRRSSDNEVARRPVAAVTSDPGAWSPGLWSEPHAALVGRIAGLMPQVEELIAELAVRLLGHGPEAGRAIFSGLADDKTRSEVLRALLPQVRPKAERDLVEAALAGARRRWRGYVHGLWHTDADGRVFLAPPREAVPVSSTREVTVAELEAVLDRLRALAATLPDLARVAAKGHKSGRATPDRAELEIARPGRAAPKREPGARRRRTRAAPGDFAV